MTENKNQDLQTPQIEELTTKTIHERLNNPIFKSFVVFSLLSVFITSFYAFWLNQQFKKTLSTYLPTEFTVAFLETKVSILEDSSMHSWLNFDQLLLNQTNISQYLQSVKQKNLSFQFFENQVLPLFIYRLPAETSSLIQFPIQIENQSSEYEWFYTKKDDILIISPSQNLNSLILDKNKPSIYTHQDFQESIINIPRHNIANFGINFPILQNSSLDPISPNNIVSNLYPLFDQFSFASGAIIPEKSNFALNLYLKPSDSKTLSPKFSLAKYKDTLLKYEIPQEIDYLHHGNNLSNIILNFLENTSSNYMFSFENLFIQKGLDQNSISDVFKIFQKEYLIYKAEKTESVNLVLPKQDIQTQQLILDLLSSLEAFYNPVLSFQTLPDFSRVSLKTPNQIKPRKVNYSNTSYFFELTEIEHRVEVDFTDSDIEKITYYTSTKSSSSQNIDTQSFKLRPKHSEATSMSYYSTNYLKDNVLSPSLSNIFDDFSHMLLTNYFFDDGIQLIMNLYE